MYFIAYDIHVWNFFNQVWLRMPRPPPPEMPESMKKRLEQESKKQ